jgi:hypothetical protein
MAIPRSRYCRTRRVSPSQAASNTLLSWSLSELRRPSGERVPRVDGGIAAHGRAVAEIVLEEDLLDAMVPDGELFR